MRKDYFLSWLGAALFLSCLFVEPVLAQEDTHVPCCPGVWILEYHGFWQVRQGEKVLRLQPATRVLGCQGQRQNLDPKFSGVKALIRCRIEEMQGKKVYCVDEIRLICE